MLRFLSHRGDSQQSEMSSLSPVDLALGLKRKELLMSAKHRRQWITHNVDYFEQSLFYSRYDGEFINTKHTLVVHLDQTEIYMMPNAQPGSGLDSNWNYVPIHQGLDFHYGYFYFILAFIFSIKFINFFNARF